MSSNTHGLNADSEFSKRWLEVSHKKSISWNSSQLIRRFSNGLLELLSPSSSLRIFAVRNSRGETYYRVYDISSNEFHRFQSEEEVRIWLEGRYHS